MVNEIVCIGTSFTEGHGLNPKKIVNEEIESEPAVLWYKENKGIEIKSMTQYSWPSQLQTISGIKTRNLGKCGSSIEYLMRNVEEIIEKEDVSDKFFILEYSSWGRSELWSTKHNEWVVANWGPRDGNDPTTEGYAVMITTNYQFGTQLDNDEFKIYESFLDNYFNEHEYLIQRDRHFLNLLYKLKSKDIKYQVIMLETPYWEELSNNPLFNYKDIIEDDLWGHITRVKLSIENITKGSVKDSHPSIEGHEYISKLIYDKLKQKKIL